MYEHTIIKTIKVSPDHHQSLKYASDVIEKDFLQIRIISLILTKILFQSLFNEMNERDTDNYSGAKYGELITVSNAYDCVKRCYVDSNCQAYQINSPNSHQLKCQLFSEAVESPLKPVALEYKKTIGIKPNRLSSIESLHLTFRFIIIKHMNKKSECVFNYSRTSLKVMK